MDQPPSWCNLHPLPASDYCSTHTHSPPPRRDDPPLLSCPQRPHVCDYATWYDVLNVAFVADPGAPRSCILTVRPGGGCCARAPSPSLRSEFALFRVQIPPSRPHIAASLRRLRRRHHPVIGSQSFCLNWTLVKLPASRPILGRRFAAQVTPDKRTCGTLLESASSCLPALTDLSSFCLGRWSTALASKYPR
jgi:hypothetical protein